MYWYLLGNYSKTSNISDCLYERFYGISAVGFTVHCTVHFQIRPSKAQRERLMEINPQAVAKSIKKTCGNPIM